MTAIIPLACVLASYVATVRTRNDADRADRFSATCAFAAGCAVTGASVWLLT